MAERSGIHITGVDSGWPVAGSAESTPKKSGAYGGDAGNPHADKVEQGIVTTSTSTNEVQTAVVTGTAGSENWKLTFNGRTTGNIAFGASAAVVKAAIVAATELKDGDIDVARSGSGPYTYTITFVGGDYAHKNVPAFTATNVSLTGAGNGVVIATPTPGVV